MLAAQSYSFPRPAIAIEMSPPDMIAMFDNVQNEEYNTPVSIVNRASNEGMQRPLPDLQILKAAQRSLCQHPNFVLCLTCVLNVRHFQPGVLVGAFSVIVK